MRLILTFCVIILLAAPLAVQADSTDCPPWTICIENPLKYKDIGGVITAITELLKGLAISIGVIMLIISGIQIMTAGGNEEQLKKGKKTMTWTVVGVAIVILINFIVGFVTEILTGS